MFGLAAAPEIAIAVPSVMPWRSPYCSLGRYAPLGWCAAWLAALPLSLIASLADPAIAVSDEMLVPQCSGLTVNGAALRSCHASRFDETMLRVMLMIWNGRQSLGVAK